MRVAKPIMILAAFGCLTATTIGCVSPGVRLSSVRWNHQQDIVGTKSDSGSRVLKLAGRSTESLERLMEKCPAPYEDELEGTWYGVNKGYGAALAGLHQDVKVFHCSGGQIFGHNILVKQVRVEDLACEGWEPKTEFGTQEPKKMGNFAVKTCVNDHGKRTLLLDYSQGNNPALDPSRFLVDELVVVEPGLMLGRARVQVKDIGLPIAFFALSRERTTQCDSCITQCDSLCDQ